MNKEIRDKIITHLSKQSGFINEIKITSEKNKDGINLYYLKTTEFEKKERYGSKYINQAYYYAYDEEGNHVATAFVYVTSPDTIEVDYKTEDEYMNKGNITVLMKEVIREVFDDKVFDMLKTKENGDNTSIKKITLSINPYNLASQRVAEKLGFDDFGYLRLNDYNTMKSENNKTSNY